LVSVPGAQSQRLARTLEQKDLVWRDSRSTDYKFENVYSVGSYGDNKGDANNFNKKAQAAGLGIIRRECGDCRGDQHNDKFFVRKTNPKEFNYYQYLLQTWSTNGNTFHRDFDIYNNLDDAIADRNPWKYCNANDPGVGFPRDCGPTVYVPHIWNALPSSRHYSASRKNYRYSVVQRAGPPTTTVTTSTVTTKTATTTTTVTTATDTTTTTTSTTTTVTTIAVCEAGEFRDQWENTCVECPDNTYQPAQSHQITRCAYAPVSCGGGEHIITPGTKKTAVVCASSTECAEDEFESKAPKYGKTDRECTPLTVCQPGQYEDDRPRSRSDRTCKECDDSSKAMRGGCTTTVTTATSSTKTRTTRTYTTKTRTTNTKTTTTTSATTTTVTTITTTIKQPDPDDLFSQKEDQTADGVSVPNQIATQLEQGTSVASLLAGGYTLDDIKDSNVSSDELNDAISSLREKAEQVSNSVIESNGGDRTTDENILKIKRSMDRESIPTFVQINDLLSAGTTADTDTAVTIDYLTALFEAGYTKEDFVDTEITSAQLDAAYAESSASTANNPNKTNAASTSSGVLIAVVGIVLLVVVVAVFIVLKKGNSGDAVANATSFENPFYATNDAVHNPVAAPEGAYGEQQAAGYMDITPTTGGPPGPGAASGYMDVHAGDNAAYDNHSDEEEI